MKLSGYPDLEFGSAGITSAASGVGLVNRVPWWLEEALQWERNLGLGESANSSPSLVGHIDVDTAIVGGGYTGMWTAMALLDREPSMRVAVLEQAICGHGASGRNGGLVSGYWRYLPGLTARYGSGAAVSVALAGAKAQDGLRELIERTGADVWWQEAGHLKVASTKDAEGPLEAVVAEADRLGYPEQATLLSADKVGEFCSADAFGTGVLFKEGAQVQPARLARLIRSQLIARGASVFERTPVLGMTPGRVSELTTPRGRVRATDVVLATNAALSRHKVTARQLTPFSSHIALTPPIPDIVREHGWKEGVAVFDTMMFPHYFRTTPDGRIAMGTGSGMIGRYGKVTTDLFIDDAATARAQDALRLLFPRSEGRITHAWGGAIDVSADKLPFFGTDRTGRLHFAAGFSGHGVNPSWIAGQTLASKVLRTDDEWTQSILCTRKVAGFPPEPARTWGGVPIRAAILNIEEAVQAGRRPRIIDLALAAIPRITRMPLGTR